MILYRSLAILSIWLGLSCATMGPADPQLKPVAPLPAQLTECSGLEKISPDLLVGINDSGNPAELYVFERGNERHARVVRVAGAENYDWEELALDDLYLYIGDIGNNSGNRRDLTIYRVSRAEVLELDEVVADKITFDYPEQTRFEPSNMHNFDCEAMVSLGDSLYLFTKNRGNLRSTMYAIPKTSGHHHAIRKDEFDADALITGASLWSANGKNQLTLVGYTVKSKGYHPMVYIFEPVNGTDFFTPKVDTRKYHGSLQTETILFDTADKLLVTNEEEHGDKGFLYEIDLKIRQ